MHHVEIGSLTSVTITSHCHNASTVHTKSDEKMPIQKPLPRTNVGLLDIPNELLIGIGEYLSIEDLASLRKTCHHHSSLHAKRLYTLGLQRDYGMYTALQWAASRGHVSLVEQAIASGASVAEQGGGLTRDLGALHLAAANNHHEVIRILLKHKAPIAALDWEKWTPLHYAAGCENPEGAKVLLEHGADMTSLDQFGHSPATIAVDWGSVECVEAFIAAGWDLNSEGVAGRTLLHSGASNSVEMLRYLLQYKKMKLAVNVQDSRGATPLHLASSAESLQLLLDNGANIESKDIMGNTPAHYAARLGNLSSLVVLIDAGFDIKTRGYCGCTVLHTAAYRNRTAVVKYLLDEVGGAALINVTDSTGCTPLALAAKPGQELLIKLLIERGADLEAKDTYGKRLADTIGVDYSCR